MQDPRPHPIALKLSAAGATDIGRGRRHNEDNVLLRPDLHLYVLADGAGGHNAGNVASALATTSIANHIESTQPDGSAPYDVDEFGLSLDARRLATAIQRANRDIIEIARTSNKRKGMGTTVVAALVSPPTAQVHVAHVGDSRCYRLRGGYLEQLTHDHSLLNDVLELKPDMAPEQLARLPRHVVTRALGMEEPVRVSMQTYQLATGDRFLLCSDGLTEALDTEAITEAMRLPKSADELVRLLIDLSNEKGAQDNIAAVLIACETAPMTAVVPRRRPAPRSRASVPPPPVAVDGDTWGDEAPEIVMLGEGGAEIEDGSQIHVVPAETASQGLLDALDAFDTLVGSTRKPRG